MRFWKRQLACSFCHRTDHEVEKLVAGPRVYICDQCVAIARRLMEEHQSAPAPASAQRVHIVRRVTRWIAKIIRLGTTSPVRELSNG